MKKLSNILIVKPSRQYNMIFLQTVTKSHCKLVCLPSHVKNMLSLYHIYHESDLNKQVIFAAEQ